MKKRGIGQPHFRLLNMDGRGPEARLLRKVTEELVKHVGGNPSTTQLLLIEQAAWLRLHLTQLNARSLEDGGFSRAMHQQYLSASNSLERITRALGLKAPAPPEPKPRTLADITAEIEAGKLQSASAA